MNSTTGIPTMTTTYSFTTTTTTKRPECLGTATIVNARSACQGELVFEENFNELSDKNWLTEVRFAGEPVSNNYLVTS